MTSTVPIGASMVRAFQLAGYFLALFEKDILTLDI